MYITETSFGPAIQGIQERAYRISIPPRVQSDLAPLDGPIILDSWLSPMSRLRLSSTGKESRCRRDRFWFPVSVVIQRIEEINAHVFRLGL